ncbi:hypothetical protein H310_02498 [Aphanomyces invadans]|uniref:Uncharacterized protein n=1 Tax=Aphanomyces invadans TaxID=157072 RepID=A0A024UNY4_9STRA|nr:hypothetical protein H310_02498 [Aphanomyces invadans]ETW08161.1 hypothetical protein H310_02498 [Aphanomyces invadans]|eukprot:XP_008864254.1 hypothetical protein H310_02498 [Aphanomyces invadans]
MQALLRVARTAVAAPAVKMPFAAAFSSFEVVSRGFPAHQVPSRPPILFQADDALDAVLENLRLSSEPIVGMQLLGRNSRKPKKANHGKRPCSHVRRRSKRLK